MIEITATLGIALAAFFAAFVIYDFFFNRLSK